MKKHNNLDQRLKSLATEFRFLGEEEHSIFYIMEFVENYIKNSESKDKLEEIYLLEISDKKLKYEKLEPINFISNLVGFMFLKDGQVRIKPVWRLTDSEIHKIAKYWKGNKEFYNNPYKMETLFKNDFLGKLIFGQFAQNENWLIKKWTQIFKYLGDYLDLEQYYTSPILDQVFQNICKTKSWKMKIKKTSLFLSQYLGGYQDISSWQKEYFPKLNIGY